VAGDPNKAKDGKFDPADVFKNIAANLLGGISLQDVLDVVNDFIGSPAKALKITSKELDDPHRVETTLDWHPDLKSGPPGLDLFEAHDDSTFDLKAVIVTNLEHPSKSTFTIDGKMTNVIINLFGTGASQFVIIPIDQLTFHAAKGKKTDVKPTLGDVQFVGALHFVEELSEYLKFGDGSGLNIDTKGTSIKIELKLALPSIGVGVFSLKNIAIIAGTAIPYDGSPVRFRFSFCTRDNPFKLLISIFGGGGFVGLEIGVDGVELFEFSFEFGAGISIDLGIASGSIELMGGVYFKVETTETNGKKDQHLTFEAYVKLHGEITALGIVSISIELDLSLTYEGPNPEKLTGEATLTVTIKVLFFSGSVSLHAKKEFVKNGGGSAASQVNAASAPHAMAHTARSEAAGAEGFAAPLALGQTEYTFGDVMQELVVNGQTINDWHTYCDAFATV
jgi:hypothetical protein